MKLRLGELTFDPDVRQLLNGEKELHLRDAVLEDLGSKNGTFVNGERVSTVARLKDGDEVQIGSVVSRFRMTSPKGATATWSGHDRAS